MTCPEGIMCCNGGDPSCEFARQAKAARPAKLKWQCGYTGRAFGLSVMVSRGGEICIVLPFFAIMRLANGAVR